MVRGPALCDDDREMSTTIPDRDLRRAYRDSQQPIIGGVAAGLARHLGLPVLWVRVGFVVATLVGGIGVVFYAGLQTVPQDTVESAKIDGASRWEVIRYVIIPHLAPLATFVALVQLMDNFRVFEPIVGFSAEANATSLSWLVFNDLVGQDAQLFGSAASTSVITIVGVLILLTPVLRRTWREFTRKAV